jgi:hypothetical protein
LRNWLIASANIVASEGGIAFLLPRSLGNSSTTIALHPSIASRNVMNIARRPRPRGSGGVGINTKAGNRQEDRPGGTRKARPVPSARKAVGIGRHGASMWHASGLSNLAELQGAGSMVTICFLHLQCR